LRSYGIWQPPARRASPRWQSLQACAACPTWNPIQHASKILRLGNVPVDTTATVSQAVLGNRSGSLFDESPITNSRRGEAMSALPSKWFAWTWGLLLVSGCCYPVRDQADRALAELTARPLDLAPMPPADQSTHADRPPAISPAANPRLLAEDQLPKAGKL